MKLLLSTTSRGPWRRPSQIRRQANPKGKPAVRRQVDQTLPHDGAKSAHFCSMCGPYPRRNEPSRGIRGESDNRVALARRTIGPGGGHVVNITEDVRKYAAELQISEDEALKKGMEEKSKEFTESGAEVYMKA